MADFSIESGPSFSFKTWSQTQVSDSTMQFSQWSEESLTDGGVGAVLLGLLRNVSHNAVCHTFPEFFGLSRH